MGNCLRSAAAEGASLPAAAAAYSAAAPGPQLATFGAGCAAALPHHLVNAGAHPVEPPAHR